MTIRNLLILGFVACAFGASAQRPIVVVPDDWTDVSEETPATGKGNFRYRKGTVIRPPDTRKFDVIYIQFVPKDINCDSTALIQTQKTWFELTDRAKDIMSPPDEILEVDEWLRRARNKADSAWAKKMERNLSGRWRHNGMPDGTTVDSKWSDQDPYFNGDDANDLGADERGSKTKETGMYDRPSVPDDFFTGKRIRVVIEFEVCAYCYKPDGTVGENLGCFKYGYERYKGRGQGSILIPAQPKTAPPTAPHTGAVDRFVERHTKQEGDVTMKFCPEWKELDDIPLLEQRIKEETDEKRKKELKALLEIVLQQKRQSRSR